MVALPNVEGVYPGAGSVFVDVYLGKMQTISKKRKKHIPDEQESRWRNSGPWMSKGQMLTSLCREAQEFGTMKGLLASFRVSPSPSLGPQTGEIQSSCSLTAQCWHTSSGRSGRPLHTHVLNDRSKRHPKGPPSHALCLQQPQVFPAASPRQ